MQPTHQRKIVTVDRGLYLVRYAESEDTASAPSVRLTSAPGSRNDIRFLLHPDESEPVLAHPGASLVMRADMPGRVTVDITPARSNGSVAAKIRFEPLTQSRSSALPAASDVPDPLPAPSRNSVLQVLGHVASRGDVTVETAAWLAGPAAPARIEGFQIDWADKPHDLEIRYAVKTPQSRGAFGPWAGPGTFVGSRGRAQPILGLMIDIGGPAAARVRCAAEMIFLGSPLLRVAGSRIEGAGPTGREPLVGLRLSVTDIVQEDELSAATRIRPPAPIERVKIFRSQALDHRPTV